MRKAEFEAKVRKAGDSLAFDGPELADKGHGP